MLERAFDQKSPVSPNSFQQMRDLEESQESVTVVGTPANADSDIEKHAEDPDRSPSENDVAYRYLTFEETNIYPRAALRGVGVEDTQSPLKPDLQKYENPLEWPETRKKLHMWLCCFGTLVAAYSPGAYLAGTQQLQAEFHQSPTLVALGVTVFTGCFAIAPMVLAPFSEIIGRKPLFTTTGIIYVVSQLGTGVSASFAGLMVSRATGGMAASTFSSMVAGVLSDIYSTRDRNRPMVMFSAGTMIGTGLGPGISGIMVQHLSWRWTWYLQTITCGIVVLAQFIFQRETRGGVLLSRRAKRLNAWYAEREAANLPGLEETTSSGRRLRIRWKVKSDEERASIPTMIKISLVRPFHLLLTEPILFWFSAWVAFAWMILYLTFGGIPLLFTTNHGFNSQANGLVFFAIVISSTIISPICIYQEKLARRWSSSSRSDNHSGDDSSSRLGRLLRFDDTAPESRLYFVCAESALLPIGLFWLAWTQFASIHWIVPTLAIGVTNIGIFVIYLAGFNYLADVYHIYASSAIAAQSFFRNMLGATIPLYNDQMLEKMTFQGGLSFLGGIATLLAFVPWILYIWGPSLRARSKVATRLSGAG